MSIRRLALFGALFALAGTAAVAPSAAAPDSIPSGSLTVTFSKPNGTVTINGTVYHSGDENIPAVKPGDKVSGDGVQLTGQGGLTVKLDANAAITYSVDSNGNQSFTADSNGTGAGVQVLQGEQLVVITKGQSVQSSPEGGLSSSLVATSWSYVNGLYTQLGTNTAVQSQSTDKNTQTSGSGSPY
ncbi:MAG: hypothetical protein KGM24_08685 [Elusimicrobia bacterium]|nr:hypothetical protein [Elusimicrobiota bacterium]